MQKYSQYFLEISLQGVANCDLRESVIWVLNIIMNVSMNVRMNQWMHELMNEWKSNDRFDFYWNFQRNKIKSPLLKSLTGSYKWNLNCWLFGGQANVLPLDHIILELRKINGKSGTPVVIYLWKYMLPEILWILHVLSCVFG